jgi:DNA replication protein DnaC
LLQHPTIDRLRELGLEGMAKSLRDLTANPESNALDHMEWLGILLEHEMTLRQQKRFEARARTAKLRHLASVEDIDYRAARGLDRTLFLKLAGCDWIREHRHCLLTGPCEQILVGLRTRLQGMPGKPLGALSARPSPVHPVGFGPG